jgi:hypothetical protein
LGPPRPLIERMWGLCHHRSSVRSPRIRQTARLVTVPAAEDREQTLTVELIQSGGEMAGAAAGAAIGLIGGPGGVIGGAAAGAAMARILKRVGAEIRQRMLGPREEVRVGAVAAFAASAIAGALAEGRQLRDDGFFEERVGDPPGGRGSSRPWAGRSSVAAIPWRCLTTAGSIGLGAYEFFVGGAARRRQRAGPLPAGLAPRGSSPQSESAGLPNLGGHRRAGTVPPKGISRPRHC